METPASTPEQFKVDEKAARAVIDAALAEGRGWLSEFEAKQVLEAYDIPVVETLKAGTPDEAAEAARRIGKPVALKILSVDIIHKSDIGGVQLHIKTPEEVRAKAVAMLDRVRSVKPDARIEGFTVQAMASKPGAHELIVGMADNPLFGPVLLFGQGGTSVEVVQDKALGLPPLNTNLAREMMSRTRVWKLLQGYRDRPPAAIDQVALTLIKISQMITDIAEIVELDINPLLADDAGVLALDARIKVAVPTVQPGTRRLAIRPYPKKLEERVKLNDGREYLLRPVRPEDEPIVHRMFEQMTPEDIRLRFFAPMKRLSHQMAARLTQIDYDREMALVAVAPNEDGQRRALRHRPHRGRPRQPEGRIRRDGPQRHEGQGPGLCADDQDHQLRPLTRHRRGLRRGPAREHHHAGDVPRAGLHAEGKPRRAGRGRGDDQDVVSGVSFPVW